MHASQIIQNVYLPQVDLSVHYSQLRHFQKGAVDDAHHPRIVRIVDHENLSVSIVHSGIVHTLCKVRSQ